MKMLYGSLLVRAGRIILIVAALPLVLAANLGAQGGNAAQGPATPRAAAPTDLTGYWVSVVTEDWRWRMVVPDKSDYVNIPLNSEGRKVADAWDPAKDQASGDQCKGYGAAAILNVPGRLHIYWQDDNTLRIDADSGTQTRLLHFAGSAPQSEAPTWQGYSVASWGEQNDPIDQRVGGGGPVGQGGPEHPEQDTPAPPTTATTRGPRDSYLKVVTTHMRPGYLRKNGVPYGGKATSEEYITRFSDPYRNDAWLMVTIAVTDPQYLIEPFISHSHFKKIPDNAGWDPTPCRADQPR
jgi:hypothetical protein